MLYQIHHQFKDGHTEMCSQSEINTQEELEMFVDLTKAHYPLPKGATYMICNEKSEYFKWGLE